MCPTEDMKNEDALSQSHATKTTEHPFDPVFASVAKEFSSLEHLETLIASLFHSIDSDGSGLIEFTELARFLRKFSAVLKIEEVRLTENHYEELTKNYSLCDDKFCLRFSGLSCVLCF